MKQHIFVNVLMDILVNYVKFKVVKLKQYKQSVMDQLIFQLYLL